MRSLVVGLGLLLVGASGCASGPEVRPEEAPVLCRLASRSRLLTVYVAGSPQRFTIHDGDGRLLASGGALDDLALRDPELYRLFRRAYASDDGAPAPVLLAN